MHRVVTREVRIGLRIAEVIERNDLHLRIALGLVERAQNVAPNTTVTVDPHLYCHALIPLDKVLSGL